MQNNFAATKPQEPVEQHVKYSAQQPTSNDNARRARKTIITPYNYVHDNEVQYPGMLLCAFLTFSQKS